MGKVFIGLSENLVIKAITELESTPPLKYAPTCITEFEVAQKLIGQVITSSPSPISQARSAKCNAAV